VDPFGGFYDGTTISYPGSSRTPVRQLESFDLNGQAYYFTIGTNNVSASSILDDLNVIISRFPPDATFWLAELVLSSVVLLAPPCLGFHLHLGMI